MSSTRRVENLWPEPYASEIGGQVIPDGLGASLADRLKIAPDIAADLLAIYQPLANDCAVRSERQRHSYILGINGAQGTGKSTAAQVMGMLLKEMYGKRVCLLSIDDLYLGRDARRELACQVHPLLMTRGVPGTHNLPLALQLFAELKEASSTQVTLVPRFNKALDDCEPKTRWERFSGRPDIIIFEGWCVGARAQPKAALQKPVNTLESDEDPDGTWRNYVNENLMAYQSLFQQIDLLVMLKAPSFAQVLEWRQLQEKKLRESLSPAQLLESKVMTDEQIARFIAHYERLTRWMFAEMPARSDVLLMLDKDHQIAAIECHNRERLV